jgi:thymidylate kinase
VNRYYLPTPYLLKGRVIRHGVPCLSPETEALHILIKRIVKAHCSPTECAKLRVMYHSSSPFREEVHRWFGRSGAADIAALLDPFSGQIQASLMRRLGRLLWRRRLLRHPFLYIRRWQLHVLRVIGRLARPTGYFVVIVGPDGSGKSTIAAALGEQLERAFRHVWQFHWRPQLLPRLSRGGTAASHPEAPPDGCRYGSLLSLARFLYYWLDFVIGYWLLVYGRTAQTTLVIGERYYHDVIVNPERYGFALPPWLLRLASHWVPAPDLTVLLENRAEVIHRRKSELAPSAIARQIAAFRQELPRWGHSLIVETTADPAATAEAIGLAILRECGKKIA